MQGEQSIEAVASLAAGAIAADGKAARAAKKYEQWKSTPGWMVVTSRRSDDPLVDREDYAACCCAVQNFMVRRRPPSHHRYQRIYRVTREEARMGDDRVYERRQRNIHRRVDTFPQYHTCQCYVCRWVGVNVCALWCRWHCTRRVWAASGRRWG